MDQFVPLLAFLMLVVALLSHAGNASPVQDYWNSILPNTPMPSAITERVTSVDDVKSNVGVGIGVGKGGANVGVGVNPGKGKSNEGSAGVGVQVGKGGVNVGVGVNPPRDHDDDHHRHELPPLHGGFVYRYAASETQLRDNPEVARFFLPNDLRPGKSMTLQFTRTIPRAPFIPRPVADTLPFSSSKLPDILAHLGISPESDEAVAYKNTLRECEAPAVKGEKKTCATSLETMVEFATSSLGTDDVQATSTLAVDDRKQKYTIAASGVRKLSGGELVACHAEAYAYAVFYCHWTGATEAYTVRVVGEDGAVVDAVAVCHKNTAAWNPKHLAFRVLNVKPGTAPVCHFLPQDHLVWAHRA